MVSTRGNNRKRRKLEPGLLLFDDAKLKEVERLDEARTRRQIANDEAAAKEEKRKRREEEDSKCTTDLFQLLPAEMVSRILSFVSDTGDLYSLSIVNKTCRSEITSRMIIRTAIFGRNMKAKNILSDVMEYVGQRSIYLPSQWRLLRLLNGRSCERVDKCYGYNLTTKAANNVSRTDRPFGLCICALCEREMTSTSTLNYRSGWEHERIATAPHYRVQVIENLQEHCTQASVGSLVLGRQISQIINSYPLEERKDRITDLCNSIDETIPQEGKEKAEALFDYYRQTQHEFTCKKEAKENIDAKEREAKREAQRQRKRSLSEPIFNEIEQQLEGFHSNADLLEGDWNTWNGIRSFKIRITSVVLGPLLSAPSSVTNARITAQVSLLKQSINSIYELGLANGRRNLLSCLRGSREDHVTAVHAYRYQLDKAQYLSSSACLKTNFDLNFLAKCREDGPFAALFSLFTEDDKRGAFVAFCLSEEPQQEDWVLPIKRKLAKTIWAPENRQHGWLRYNDVGTYDVPSYRAKFESSKREYETLSENLDHYLNITLVKKYLRKTKPPRSRPVQTVTRRDVLKKLVIKKHGGRDFLRNRDWNALHALHRAIFVDPYRYPDN